LGPIALFLEVMAVPKPFRPAKLVAGVIFAREIFLEKSEEELKNLFGAVDMKSQVFPFDLTNYYEEQMGTNLKRIFLSFAELVPPESLSEMKTRTNALEEKIRRDSGENFRVVNIDPGILTASSLIMATTKDFSHRIPLAGGIYAHLEFLFAKDSIRVLDWTYPDFKREGCRKFFLETRRIYLAQLKQAGGEPN
jgi:hypothetical protein